jgi:hypothetical protein
MVFLSAGPEYVLLAEDAEGDETTMFLYDCKRRKRLLFLHIPKNAGTTIEDISYRQGIQWGRHDTADRMRNANRMPDGNNCNGWHTPPSHYPWPNPYESADVFCIVREPKDRLMSEYRYLLSTPQGHRNPRLRTAPECTEAGLNNFLSLSLRMMLPPQSQLYISDCHFLPQSKFIWEGQKQWCTNVIRISDLPYGFNSVMAEKGYPIRLGAEKHNSKSYRCPGLSTGSFSPETKQLIRQVYAEDFARLNYPPPT